MNAMRTGLAALSLLAMSSMVQAHKAWLLPSQTVLSNEGGWITVDGAVSNDLFYFNHVPLRADGLVVTAPDGATLEPQNVGRGKFRTTFDLQLQKPGTYRIAVVNDSVNARYEQNGEQKRWRGANLEQLAKEVPAGVAKLEVTQSQNRIETFVTVGKPSDVTAIKGQGLELLPVTHPNDLYAGETATLRFVLDGKPAAGVEVEIIAGGSRYRDAQGELNLKTDAQGEIKVTWPESGMYWLEASIRDAKPANAQLKSRNAGYVGTFEVLNQ